MKSIFYKGATLHDGAAIIKNGRIDYARCVLPMTSRVDIPIDLGTRHRAALGTTETTDAIVVIVSEESGIISLSIDGELERGFTYDSLCTRLEELLNPTKGNNDKTREKKKNRNKKKKKNNAAAKKAEAQSDYADNGDIKS